MVGAPFRVAVGVDDVLGDVCAEHVDERAVVGAADPVVQARPATDLVVVDVVGVGESDQRPAGGLV
jgi:hypothetical protein